MSSNFEQLAKLQELRSAGALTDEEFEAQKHALLTPRQPVPNFISAAIAGIVLLSGAAAAGYWLQLRTQPVPSASTPKSPKPGPRPLPTPPPSPSADARTPEARLTDAFEAATGHRTAFTQTVDGNDYSNSPIKIINLPFGPALLTRREIKDGCHACTGYIGIYYLHEEGGQTLITGSYPKAVGGWGWGAAPNDWQMTTRFTKNPAIFASGGFMAQGVVESSSTLTELRPDGPATSDVIGTGFSDSGSIAEGDTRTPCEVQGKISDIVVDRSFDVILSGSVSGRDRYVKKGPKFVATKRIDWGIPFPIQPAG